MENSKNEINLIDLLVKTYINLVKYKKIVIILIILGIIYPFIIGKYLLKEYESTMILSVKPDNDFKYAFNFETNENKTNTNHIEMIDNIITSIDQQMISKNTASLSKKLNIDEKLILNIKSISGIYKLEEKLEPLNIYKVNITIKDTVGLHKIGKGIVNLINKNEFIEKKIKSDSVYYSSLLKKTELKILQLDSIQKMALKDNSKSYNLIGVENKSYITESIQLMSLKEKLIFELNNLNKVEIVENFYTPQVVHKLIYRELIISVFIAFFISLMIISIIILHQKAKNYKKSIT